MPAQMPAFWGLQINEILKTQKVFYQGKKSILTQSVTSNPH
jgi:hypothetical protein